MAKKATIAEKAEIILASNPSIDVIYMCSNGQGFTSEGKAENVQLNLDQKKKVQVFKRAEKEAPKTEAPKKAEPKKEEPKTKAPKAEASKK